ncbi:CLUMA_CG009619, isoform A [Clunio marinus]|uniref:CLUMA_CG009619, isoform A n=1 Tax=Clunio marinus TaxID=568069 RepID=A0A1J1IB38_9DIPT|nr:CLUMA_CG009619, isoform A [Clunio marinus]
MVSKSAFKPIEKEGKIGFKARNVLWYLTFSGFAINYMIRVNVSIAIVDMIDTNFKKLSSEKKVVTSECIVEQNLTTTPELNNKSYLEDNLKYVSIERRLLDFLGVEYERDGFKWDEHQQSHVLGSFYWLHWLTQLPGGILATKYGTKYIFLFSNLFACLLCIIMPISCYFNYRWMTFLRVIQGFIAGFAWPAMNSLTSKWIPPNERSKFISSYQGSSIGVAISLPILGYIIKISSWEWAFHSCAICGVIWSICWLYYVYDSPENHPRIHPKEKEYILKSLGSSVIRSDEKKIETPWKEILTSKPVWIHSLAQWGGIWGIFTIMTQAPTYFRFIHGWGIEMAGILSGFPHLLRVTFAILFSLAGDYILSKNMMTRSNLRKLATFFSLIVNGLAVICFALSGCNVVSAVFFLTFSLAMHGAVSTGVLASIVDISPNFSSITLGIVSTVSIMTGFVSPIVVGYITFENQSVQAWQYIFLICAAKQLFCGTIFILFNDSSLQSWNNPKIETTQNIKEMKALNVDIEEKNDE